MYKKLIIFLLAAGLLGGSFFLGYKFKDNETKNGGAHQFGLGDSETELGMALYQHHSLAIQSARLVFEDKNDVSVPAIDELKKTSREVGNAIGRMYGEDKADQADRLWERQATIIINYATSIKSADDKGIEQAEKDLDGLNVEITDFFAKANSGIEKEELAKALKEYADQVKASFKAYIDKNYQTSFEDESATYKKLLALSRQIKNQD